MDLRKVYMLTITGLALIILIVGVFSSGFGWIWFFLKYCIFIHIILFTTSLPVIGLYQLIIYFKLKGQEGRGNEHLKINVLKLLLIIIFTAILVLINLVLSQAIRLSLEDPQRSDLLWYAFGFLLSGSPYILAFGDLAFGDIIMIRFNIWLLKIFSSSMYIAFCFFFGWMPSFINRLSEIIAV